MKRQSYLSLRGVRRPPSVSFMAGAVVIGIGILFIFLRVVAPGALIALTSPLARVGGALSASVENSTKGFTSTATLTRERDALTLQNATLANENAVLAARVGDLTLLTGNGSTTIPGIPAGVLARPPVTPYDTLLVALPSKASVRANDLVLAMGGVPVGIVESQGAGVARVRLFSTSGAQTAGWIGAARMPVTIIGAGAGTFTASVPNAETILVGDGVYVPGPGSLPIGTVVRVDRDPSSPSSVIQIRPLVNPFSITEVEIEALSS